MFRLASIELKDVVAGDTLELEGVTTPRQVPVTAAATCTAPTVPSLFCADDAPLCGSELDEDDGGCTTGGTPALGAALILLGLLRRHRYDRRRRA
jgi:MYXO-CTERM domain-containing protein